MAAPGQYTVNQKDQKLTFNKVQDLDSGSVYSDQADILISATGALNNWKWPDIPGLHDFKGKLMHSARWDEDYDYSVGSPSHTRNVMLTLAGQKSSRDWKRVEWHSDSSWHVAKCHAYRPLY